MKTENEYAEALIEKCCGYLNYSNKMYLIATDIAINDVTNTLDALKGIATSKYDYYQNVLQILKDKLI